MAQIKIPKIWDIRESQVTPEDIYLKRRNFLKKMGILSLNALSVSALPFIGGIGKSWAQKLKRNSENNKGVKSILKPSPENLATRYNNYYEFGTDSNRIWRLVQGFQTERWAIKIRGLVKKEKTIDLQTFIKSQTVEERTYKLRCVETWTVTIPWTGFPLKQLIQAAKPLSSANYVVLKTFLNPNFAKGQKDRFWEPWPYIEGLRMDEATHDLSFLATGLYGKPLTLQNGAPIRLVIPWKYGFKSIKAIAEIEFTASPPKTFWELMSPLEYDFWANVNPAKPYARWDQSVEHILGEDRIQSTLPFNGFAQQVAQLYS